MMDVVDFAKYMYKMLKSREEEIAMSLAYGSARDWDQYQSLVGEIRG